LALDANAHERRLELDRPPRADPGERSSGSVRRDQGRISAAEHVRGIGWIGDAKADSQTEIRPDLRGHDTGRPLRGQHQVDAE
jgi:hypothetical protein